MRSLLVAASMLVAIPSAFAADTLDYNNPANQQQRMVPANQPGNTSNSAIKTKNTAGFLSSPDYELTTGLEGGYRTSELKWSIAGNSAGTSPNILSELKWENVGGYEFKPNIEYTQKTGSLKGLNLRASVNKTINNTGDNQDSDYNGDNRSGEFSRSYSDSDGGHAEGFSASIGYTFNLSGNRRSDVTRLTALVGYAAQNQTFVQRNGFQAIPLFGPFDGLRSSYDMELSMPFIGAELSTVFSNVHTIKLNGQFSKGSYTGTGHWNLRNDFVHPDSFKDEADGYGFLLGAKYAWEFMPHTQLTVASNFNYFKTDSGNSITFLSNGTSPETQFNEAKFMSIDYLLGLNYRF